MNMELTGLAFEASLAARLLLAAILGGLIGLERELHAHPAGMRTHLLVSFGAALFTIVSAYGFEAFTGASPAGVVDPTRIAAQVVSGIGFLGAGAIIKYGTSIRGLTTAGSLWATAAIGMTAGAGQLVIALAGWAIVVVSLWPLNSLIERLKIKSEKTIRIRLQLDGLEPLAAITTELANNRVEIAGVRSRRKSKNRYQVEIDARAQPGAAADGLVKQLLAIPDVHQVESPPYPA